MTRCKIVPCALTLLCVALALASHTLPSRTAPPPVAATHEAPVEPRALMTTFCGTCHVGNRSGIDFDDQTMTEQEMQRDRAAWQEVVRRLRDRSMPPRRQPQPTDSHRAAMIAWIEAVLDAPASSDCPSEPLPFADRLSYFLLRSTPDDEALGCEEDEELDAQVQGMLDDPRSSAFATAFARSWLGLDALDRVAGLDDELRQAMRAETELFVAAIVREDRSVLDFLNADFTFVNERLARHYGIPGIEGAAMRRVSTKGTPRGGLITQASFLTTTSAVDDTRPVVRGRWMLERLFGAAPIRPPAGILQAFETTPRDLGAGTTRRLVEAHRSNPSCAACHVKMDALGLPLEHFDPRGSWRTSVGANPIDPTGELPDGEMLRGIDDVKAYLLKQRDPFVLALSERLLQFALGRKLSDADRAALQHIPEAAAAHEYRISFVIQQVVQSEPFRRG